MNKNGTNFSILMFPEKRYLSAEKSGFFFGPKNPPLSHDGLRKIPYCS